MTPYDTCYMSSSFSQRASMLCVLRSHEMHRERLSRHSVVQIPMHCLCHDGRRGKGKWIWEDVRGRGDVRKRKQREKQSEQRNRETERETERERRRNKQHIKLWDGSRRRERDG